MMGSVTQNLSTASDIDGVNNANGDQQLMVGSMNGGLEGQQPWTSPSEEERSPTSPTMSPNQGISSPHASGQNPTSPYMMMPPDSNMNQHASNLKTELSPPTNGSPAIMSSYSMSNGSMTSMPTGELPQAPPYVTGPYPHQNMQYPSAMPTSFWYSPGTDTGHNVMHQPTHVDHRGMGDSGYLK